MKKELELWQFAAERLKRNESVTLLVVAESSGSSPGRQGFKMIVARDEICGSIGGGVMEINLVELAKERLKISRNETLVKPQTHQKNSPYSSGMICSGKQSVILRILTTANLKTILKLIQYIKNNRERYLRITKTNLSISAKKIPRFDFKFENQIGEFTYEEKLGFKNKLFIIGGGHCALALSELMSKMDFHISLFDDRAGLNTLAKNEFVHAKTVIENYENIGDLVASGANNFVVVMTLGYKSDEIVVRKLIDKDFRYFGVLGSRAKMKTLLRNLEKENFQKEKLNQIHTPIGLPINSRTPEEIAVSIAAEIITVKNKII